MFQGEKHHGYHVLYENLKQGEESVQELAQFLKDRASFEEENGKYLAKCILKVCFLLYSLYINGNTMRCRRNVEVDW